MGKRPPFVAVETDMRKSEGLLVMASILGCNRQEALGRLVELWMYCADRRLADAPDDSPAYAVSDRVVVHFLGERGVEAILGGEVDEFALGERRPDGLIMLRKTERGVASLRSLLATASSGGLARVQDSSQRDVGGRYTRNVNSTTITPADGWSQAGSPPSDNHPSSIASSIRAPSDSPAGTTQIPDPRSQNPEKKKKRESVPDNTHQPAIAAFDEYYRSTNGGRKPTWNAATVNAVKTLCRKHKLDEVLTRVQYLRDHPPAFPPGPWDIKMFVGNFDRLVPTTNGHNKPKTTGRVEPHPPETYADGDQKL